MTQLPTRISPRVLVFSLLAVSPILGGADGCVEETAVAAFECEASHTLTLEQGETRALPNLCAGGASLTTWDSARFELAVGTSVAGVETKVEATGTDVVLSFVAAADAELGAQDVALSVRLRDSRCGAATAPVDCLRNVALRVEVVPAGARPRFELTVKATDGSAPLVADTLARGRSATLEAKVTGAVGPVELVWSGRSMLSGQVDASVEGKTGAVVTTSAMGDEDHIYRVTATDTGVSPPAVIVADVVVRSESPWAMGPVSGSIPTYPGTPFTVDIPDTAPAVLDIKLERAEVDMSEAESVLTSAYQQAALTWHQVDTKAGRTFALDASQLGAQGVFRLVFTSKMGSTKAHYIIVFKRAY
jgi:hypothetical protein